MSTLYSFSSYNFRLLVQDSFYNQYHDDGDFDAYMSRYLHGSALAPVEEQFNEDNKQSGEPENAVDEGVASPLAEMYANAEADD